jgi:hypothetical protein
VKQYNEISIRNAIVEYGFSGKNGHYRRIDAGWERSIWVQGGIKHLAGKYTINFDFINEDLQKFYFPDQALGKGSYLLSIRIGDLLGVGDKWYNPIMEKYVDETTQEAIVDIKKAVIEFSKIDTPVKIAETLWKKNHLYLSLIVMSSYLPRDRMENVINAATALRADSRERLHQYIELSSNQSVKGS